MRLRLPALVAALLVLASAPLRAQSPIERLAGQTFTVTSNDDTCGGLVATELERRLMKRAAKGANAPFAVAVQCGGEAPRFEASVLISDSSGAVIYKASGRTGAGFKGTQANFIASVVENIFVH